MIAIRTGGGQSSPTGGGPRPFGGPGIQSVHRDGATRITFVWLSHIAGPSGQWGATRKNGKEITMDARLNYYGNAVAMKFAKSINSAGTGVSHLNLPAAKPGRGE